MMPILIPVSFGCLSLNNNTRVRMINSQECLNNVIIELSCEIVNGDSRFYIFSEQSSQFSEFGVAFD